MEKYNAKDLFRKYQQGEASMEERLLLEQLFQKDLENSKYKPAEERLLEAHQRIEDRLMQHIGQRSVAKTVQLWPGIAIASAAAIALIVCGIYFFMYKGDALESRERTSLSVNTKKSGFKKATLILGNGSSVELNASKPISHADGVEVFTDEINGLVYKARADASGLLTYNTLVIPRGAEYKLLLSDGTEVWLNADTRIKYPVSFDAGKTRDVVLERGEAYFKVIKDPSKPFIVQHGNMKVRVLGTSFNVNAYTDEINTTLVEGKVKLSLASGQAQLELLPGQQANFSARTEHLEKQDVDVYPFVAWKDGVLAYENVTMLALMEQIGRLYDYSIEFKDESLKLLHYSGSTDKSADVRKIINIIQKSSNLKFIIKERTIIVEKSTKK